MIKGQCIQSSARHAGALVTALLDLSRIARQTLHKKAVDLSALAREVRDELAAEAAERDVEWRIDPDMKVQGDADLLRVVLSNLLGNALKYTGEASPARIFVGTSGRSDGQVTFFVRDNGSGFDMTYASRLFEPFQRLHGSGEFEGTGIGLATVYRILARHGARFAAKDSRAPGPPSTSPCPRKS